MANVTADGKFWFNHNNLNLLSHIYFLLYPIVRSLQMFENNMLYKEVFFWKYRIAIFS